MYSSTLGARSSLSGAGPQMEVGVRPLWQDIPRTSHAFEEDPRDQSCWLSLGVEPAVHRLLVSPSPPLSMLYFRLTFSVSEIQNPAHELSGVAVVETDVMNIPLDW